MKPAVRYAVGGLFFLLAIFHQLSSAGQADKIVAVVGDEVILKSELQAALEFLALQKGPGFLPDSSLKNEVLDRMIDDRLLTEAAKNETILVSKAEVDEELKKSWEILRSRFATEEEYLNVLQEWGLTEKSLKERYRAEIEKRLTTQRLLAKKGLTNIYIAPKEAERFYNEHKDSIAIIPGRVKLAHILLMIQPSVETETLAQKRILEIYDILLRGGDFEEVARSFSEDGRTKKRGGYFGEVKKGEMVPEIDSLLWTLKPGEISQPIRTKAGYQIIRCEDRIRDYAKFSHILIKVPITKKDTLRTKKLAEGIRDKIREGANFDSLVKVYSFDPETKEEGGYLGELYLSSLTPPFGPVVASLAQGEVSSPVLSEHGFHLLKVIEKEEMRPRTFLEMQPEIRNYLYEEKVRGKLESYLETLRQRTFVQIISD